MWFIILNSCVDCWLGYWLSRLVVLLLFMNWFGWLVLGGWLVLLMFRRCVWWFEKSWFCWFCWGLLIWCGCFMVVWWMLKMLVILWFRMMLMVVWLVGCCWMGSILWCWLWLWLVVCCCSGLWVCYICRFLSRVINVCLILILVWFLFVVFVICSVDLVSVVSSRCESGGNGMCWIILVVILCLRVLISRLSFSVCWFGVICFIWVLMGC